MKTADEYVESLRQLNPEVYFMGERIKNVVDHPAFRPHINSASVTYKIAHMAEHRDIATATSHLTGEHINRWTHIPQTQEDLVNKVKMLRIAGQITGLVFSAA